MADGYDIPHLIEVIVSGFLTGGLGLAVFNWWRVHKSKGRGVSGDEGEAVVQVAQAGDPLTQYLKKELLRIREDFRKYRVESEKMRRADGERIDQLEAHIWQGLGPPPPPPIKKGDN